MLISSIGKLIFFSSTLKLFSRTFLFFSCDEIYIGMECKILPTYLQLKAHLGIITRSNNIHVLQVLLVINSYELIELVVKFLIIIFSIYQKKNEPAPLRGQSKFPMRTPPYNDLQGMRITG